MTVKSSFRIHNGGLLVAKLILKLGDVDAFLTAVVMFLHLSLLFNRLLFSVSLLKKIDQSDKGLINAYQGALRVSKKRYWKNCSCEIKLGIFV